MAFNLRTISSCILIVICLFEKSNSVAPDVARWCTISSKEAEKCTRMSIILATEELSPTIQCINEDSTEVCMSSIASGRADLMTLDGGDVFTGGKKYDLLPIMEEVYAGERKGYDALAVVRKSNTDVTIDNLRGKTTCHTGYGRTAGWNMPVGFLLEEGKMPSVGCQSSLESASQFFNLSCVPGALAAAKEGSDVRNLCALCNNPNQCSRSEDLYAGYTGAFRCMIEQRADVAFIKTETVLENTDGNNQDPWAVNLSSHDFEILCRDGSRRPITEHENCRIATSPSHAVVTAGDKSKNDIHNYVQLLLKAVVLFGDVENSRSFSMFDSRPWSGSDLLFKDHTDHLRALHVNNYQEFLGEEYVGSLEGLLRCPENTVRFCTISQGEQDKCEAMSTAFSNANISSTVSCFKAVNHADCMQYIEGGNCDIVTLDGGDIYFGGKYHNLVPVLGETYGEGDATYWAVAVVRANTTFNINDLQGKKSCHTGIMKTAGWIVPVGYLSEHEQIEVTNCDSATAIVILVGEFFSESCAPGALAEKYNPSRTNPVSLCDLCIGKGDRHCVRNNREPYYGYAGAFRCLAEGAGDVAFVRHVTVEEYAGLHKKDLGWNTHLTSNDFQYLCPDGTRQETWSEECSLSKVASHAVMTSGAKSDEEKLVIRNVFIQGQAIYGSEHGNGFKLFDSEDYEGSDLLFKDSTLSLLDVGNKNTYDTWLSEEYLEGIKSQDTKECRSTANGKTVLEMLIDILDYLGSWFTG
ncbi:Melanotransferrin [Holothuria leucospilota]|uniref:Melanotransferrin n=1 Tax=Holothuria leucospilota TaxID=206669 RepID=A0A9Q1BWS6_HOLLE|nr:Melanotransferrin [Holothuria leucospilota]